MMCGVDGDLARSRLAERQRIEHDEAANEGGLSLRQ